MRRWRFPIAVAVTSLVLVVALAGTGGLLVRGALAGGQRFHGPWAWAAGPWAAGPWGRGPWAGGAGAAWHGGPGSQLPAELEGLHDLPPDQRFGHFVGAQI